MTQPPLHDSFMEIDHLKNDDLLSLIASEHSWQSRYAALLKLGRKITPKPDIHKEELEVSGCEAKLWISMTEVGGHLVFALDSESRIIKALAALILIQLQRSRANEILQFNTQQFLCQQGFDRYLSPSRNSGLTKLVQHIQIKAKDH